MTRLWSRNNFSVFSVFFFGVSGPKLLTDNFVCILVSNCPILYCQTDKFESQGGHPIAVSWQVHFRGTRRSKNSLSSRFPPLQKLSKLAVQGLSPAYPFYSLVAWLEEWIIIRSWSSYSVFETGPSSHNVTNRASSLFMTPDIGIGTSL